MWLSFSLQLDCCCNGFCTFPLLQLVQICPNPIHYGDVGTLAKQSRSSQLWKIISLSIFIHFHPTMGLIIMMVLMMIIMIMIRLSQPAAARLRGNWERVGKLRVNGEMETRRDFLPLQFVDFLFFLSFPLIFSHFLSIYYISRECLENLNTRIMRKLF